MLRRFLPTPSLLHLEICFEAQSTWRASLPQGRWRTRMARRSGSALREPSTRYERKMPTSWARSMTLSSRSLGSCIERSLRCLRVTTASPEAILSSSPASAPTRWRRCGSSRLWPAAAAMWPAASSSSPRGRSDSKCWPRLERLKARTGWRERLLRRATKRYQRRLQHRCRARLLTPTTLSPDRS